MNKNLKDVLPIMIKIASEGNVIDRIADFLLKSGWSEQDYWRESKKLKNTRIAEEIITRIQNAMRDRNLGIKTTEAQALAYNLKQILKKL